LDNSARVVVDYVRVSTDLQELNGAGLDAQRAAIEAECERRGRLLATVYDDVASGGSMTKRLGTSEALAAIERGDATAVVVARLDGLSRSLVDFAALVDRSRRKGWEIVVLDLGVDTTTPNGEAMTGMLAVFAQWERGMIGQRTCEALAMKKANGVRLGRPPVLDEKVRPRIR
jgi:DNA invertase Pin-like site-specific DNA recombinase